MTKCENYRHLWFIRLIGIPLSLFKTKLSLNPFASLRQIILADIFKEII